MNNSGKSTCKEVRSSCKCMVKERPSGKGKKTDNGSTKRQPTCKIRDGIIPTNLDALESKINNNTCTATITGEIKLPANFCLCGGGGGRGTDNNDDNQDPIPEEANMGTNSCNEAYRDLGECLRDCIIKQCKNKTNQVRSYNDDDD